MRDKRAQKYQYAKLQAFPGRLELGRVNRVPQSSYLIYAMMFSIFRLLAGNNANKLGSSHHASVRLARVQVRDTQAHTPAIDHHIAFYKPLIPNLAVIRLSPEADFNF